MDGRAIKGLSIGDPVIEKIVSGGQTGADRAALDAAIALGIAHGGWLPKGRLTETGPLPETYALQEMPSAEYRDRTVQNVIDSDGTLIISRGGLTGGSALTLRAALDHGKPCLHIDLTEDSTFPAVSKAADWILASRIVTLNVAGPRASKDPEIYAEVKKIIEGIYYLSLTRENMAIPGSAEVLHQTATAAPPTTVTAAVDLIISEMSLRDRATVANMTEREVLLLDRTLGRYIAKKLNAWVRAPEFRDACARLMGKNYRRADAETAILLKLWRELKRTHKLRVIT
jgi:Circularly permutated YpsA SLOG family